MLKESDLFPHLFPRFTLATPASSRYVIAAQRVSEQPLPCCLHTTDKPQGARFAQKPSYFELTRAGLGCGHCGETASLTMSETPETRCGLGGVVAKRCPFLWLALQLANQLDAATWVVRLV